MNNQDSHCRCGTEGEQVNQDHLIPILPQALKGDSIHGTRYAAALRSDIDVSWFCCHSYDTAKWIALGLGDLSANGGSFSWPSCFQLPSVE